MRTPTLLSLSAVLIAAAPAMAAVTTTSAATATANQVAVPDSQAAASVVKAPPAEKKICKQLPSSYSRMTQRACLTAKDWKQVEDPNQ
jgi:hypothetical protein